ncbi:MAG: hypothetical protein JRN15_15975, partial [Nitrososphaerota archaeon]|nr:hypothetical protein [Nitrososphaerota archaeon]
MGPAEKDQFGKRYFVISPFENTDISQFKETIDAGCKLVNFETVFSSDLYFTYPISEREVKRKQRDAVMLIRSISDSLV